MENTLVNKEKFFALYYDQNLMSDDNTNIFNVDLDFSIKNSFLLLKSTKKIDNNSIDIISVLCDRKIGKGSNNNFSSEQNYIDYLQNGSLMQKETDVLRFLGYAIPWMDLSIEKLIEYGWIKLI